MEKQITSAQEPIKRMVLDSYPDNPVLDTFLNSNLDGSVGRKRGATIEGLLRAYGECTPELLDSLFERAYDYGREVDRLSLTPELRVQIISNAGTTIPCGLLETSPDGRTFLPQRPISLLQERTEDASKYDWPQLACLMGISAGILSLRNFEGVTPTNQLPVFNNRAIAELVRAQKILIRQIIENPGNLALALLPNVESREQYESCKFVMRVLIPLFGDTRIAGMIQAKQRNMVSYASAGGSQKYSRWSEYWENPRQEMVRQLFPEIPPENKRIVYEKASVLARIDLTRDVLMRDLERGLIPPEVMSYVNGFVLYSTARRSQIADPDGFVEFVRTQRVLSQQVFIQSAEEPNGSIADYRDIALRIPFLPQKSGLLSDSLREMDRKDIGTPTTIQLGVRSLEFLPNYQVEYPRSVIDALGILFQEYNRAFSPLVAGNREWGTDYQFCFPFRDCPINFMVQIDMVGLGDNFLTRAVAQSSKNVAEDLRDRIFEIENSIADYRYLGAVGVDIRPVLDSIRERYKRPIALLATTNRKYKEMRVAEFGEPPEGGLIDTEKVRAISGFDAFWGPDEFQRYLDENSGECNYLLYVRSSAPKTQLRNPGRREAQPLLSDSRLRQIVKANTITFNIDNPDSPLGAAQRINDTKMYMPNMGMGYPIYSIADLQTEEFASFLATCGKEEQMIRAKPALESYGGYGQIRGAIGPQFVRELNSAMRMRGPYILQPEKPYSTITDQKGVEYVYIDRNYLGWSNGAVIYLGGERTLMPVSSQEARSGRVHANEDAVLANIGITKS